jgi:hypothetical protein
MNPDAQLSAGGINALRRVGSGLANFLRAITGCGWIPYAR